MQKRRCIQECAAQRRVCGGGAGGGHRCAGPNAPDHDERARIVPFIMLALRTFAALVSSGLLLCLPLATQQAAPPAPAPAKAEAPKPQQEPELPRTVIRVPVNEVIVPVTVTDDKGRFVS